MSVADELDASTRSCFFPPSYSALAIETLSLAAGSTVSVALLVTSPADAEIVTDVQTRANPGPQAIVCVRTQPTLDVAEEGASLPSRRQS